MPLPLSGASTALHPATPKAFVYNKKDKNDKKDKEKLAKDGLGPPMSCYISIHVYIYIYIYMYTLIHPSSAKDMFSLDLNAGATLECGEEIRGGGIPLEGVVPQEVRGARLGRARRVQMKPPP